METSQRIRLALAAVASGVALLAVLAAAWHSPWLYVAFRAVCHQRPERAIWIAGAPMAICARCFGIYLGAIIGLVGLVAPPSWRPLVCRPQGGTPWAFVAAIAFVALDVLTESLGLRPAWTAGRLITGMLAGATAMPLLVSEAAEVLRARNHA